MENFTIIPLFVSLIIVIIIWFFYVSYQKLKRLENEKLNLLYLTLASEKKKANQLKNVSKKVEKIEVSTQRKILKINVAIFNLEFSLKEIL